MAVLEDEDLSRELFFFLCRSKRGRLRLRCHGGSGNTAGRSESCVPISSSFGYRSKVATGSAAAQQVVIVEKSFRDK
jgi:hypothetical protein